MKKVSNKLRVAHFPQIPCEPFIVEVKDEEQAFLVAEALANQHLFLFANRMIPDYTNVVIVEMFDPNSDGDGNADWVDYFNEQESMDWDEFADTYLSASV